jgi:hypothetical protein
MSSPELFLLGSANRDFVAGIAPAPAQNPETTGVVTLYCLGAGLAAFFGLGPLVAVIVILTPGAILRSMTNPAPSETRNSESLRISTVVWGLVWVFGWSALIFYSLRRAWRRTREEKEFRQGCRVVFGKILDSSASLGASGEYNVLAKYQVQSPSGTILEGSGSRDRQDLLGRLLPEPGTRVAVGYLDDEHHRLL